MPLVSALAIVLSIALVTLPRYLHGNLAGKHMESLTGLWTLTLYLMLGIVPLWLR
jgi:4-hydroxybenzoate polyprenyltransferase